MFRDINGDYIRRAFYVDAVQEERGLRLGLQGSGLYFVPSSEAHVYDRVVNGETMRTHILDCYSIDLRARSFAFLFPEKFNLADTQRLRPATEKDKKAVLETMAFLMSVLQSNKESLVEFWENTLQETPAASSSHR